VHLRGTLCNYVEFDVLDAGFDVGGAILT